MDTLLTVLGLLLIAAALTLMWSGPRTWLIAVAQGIGVQALVGAVASAVQTGWIVESGSDATLQQRVVSAVQGLPFNAAGWTARAMYDAATDGRFGGAVADLDDYLLIAALQIGVVAAVMGWRRMDEESLADPVRIMIWVGLIVNAVCNIQWPWWA
jgi:hypothetical protein